MLIRRIYKRQTYILQRQFNFTYKKKVIMDQKQFEISVFSKTPEAIIFFNPIFFFFHK